jgi:adenylate kinase
LRVIPIAEEIVRHARQDLVKRLDDYAENSEELFEKIAAHINEKFMPIIIRHAISGMALINSEDTLFHDPLALQILLDIFSERGYHTSIDIRKVDSPCRVDLETGEIKYSSKRIYSFRVRFEGSEIRRG